MGHSRKHFRLVDDGEYSIEVDPRKVDRATVELLGELGFNRMSVGVQDFDERVQQAVNRIQSEAETMAVIDAARANGFKSISVDLIYGLPRQNGHRLRQPHARSGDCRQPGPAVNLQLRAPAQPVQAAAPHPRMPTCRPRMSAADPGSWPYAS